MNIGEFELKATSKAYCDLKQKIGAPNLKIAFLTAYEELNLDFFAEVVMAFANPKPKNKDAVFHEFDKLMGEGFLMDDIYTTLVDFAFGMGLERLVLRRYNIDDIRLLLENDIRFLNMFD